MSDIQVMWSVYLLVSPRGRTYVGCTTDPERRLRQHNGELTGGARATKKESSWELVVYITGFRNRSEACRFEALVKHRTRGLEKRRLAILELAEGLCPRGRKSNQKIYEVPKPLSLVVNI